METNNNDLKEGEEKTPEGTDQPEKTPESEEGGEKEKPSEEMDTISKSELEQLRKDAGEKENYRKAVIRLNRAKGRALPGSEPEKKPEETGGYGDEEYVTKKDFQKREERTAINEACKDSEFEEHFDDIIVYYRPTRGKATIEDMVADLQDAKKVWKGLQPSATPLTPEKKAIADLAAEKGLSSGKKKEPTVPKKSIIPKQEKMEKWYG